jgi:hypothetical protein
MKIVQKDDSQPLLDSEVEKQEETDVEIQSQNTFKETCNPRKKITIATG